MDLKLCEQRTEIYGGKNNALKNENARRDAWDGRIEDKAIIEQFQAELIAKGTGQYRAAKVAQHLRFLSPILGVGFADARKEHIVRAVVHITTSDKWAEETKRDYKRILKHFYGWYENEDPRLRSKDDAIREPAQTLYKYLRKGVSTAKPRQALGEQTIITEVESARIIENATTPMERALLAVLHNTGARVGELLGMRIGDYKRAPGDVDAAIRVYGKTGERTIPILQAIPYLEHWLRYHPDRTNPRALLWLRKNDTPLRYGDVRDLVVHTMEKSGLVTIKREWRAIKNGRFAGHRYLYETVTGATREYNPHWWRHSRATLWAGMFPHAILCQLMGWAQGSAQAKRYVHLTAEDVRKRVREGYGIAKADEITPTVQVCRCGEPNRTEARYCFKCSQPLNVAVVLEDQRTRDQAIRDAVEEMVTTQLKNPELWTRFLDFKSARK